MQSLQPLTENVSRLDFPGNHPQRFHLATKRHIRVIDTIVDRMNANIVEEKGRRHYQSTETPVMVLRPGIKIYEENQAVSQIKFQDNGQDVLKKLIYMPPQKCIKRSSNDPLKSTKTKMTQFQKDEIERKQIDRKAVEELDQWENQINQRR